MYAIAGATGKTGTKTVDALLAAGEPVRVWVRSEDKGRAFAARGAEVAIVDVHDAASIRAGLEGVKGAYLLLPPAPTAPDFLANAARITDALVQGIAASRVPHLVVLSSTGAHHPTGTGPIRALHHLEQRLRVIDRPATYLRAAYFLENWESSLHVARANGVFPQMVGSAERKIAMVSTADIGAAAADALRRGAAASGVVDLEGPERYSPRDIADVVGERLGRSIPVVDTPFQEQEALLMSFGVSASFAALMRELNEGLFSGRVSYEGGGADRALTGATPMRSVIEALLG